jgi:hypothetical protein
MISKIIFIVGQATSTATFFIYENGQTVQKTTSMNIQKTRKIVNRVHNSVIRGYGRLFPTDTGWVYIAHPPHGDERRRQWDRGQTAMALPYPEA